MPVRRLFRGLQGLALKTKLLHMMMSLLVLSGASLFFLHLWSESKLLSQVADYTEELSTAIEIAQEQPATEGVATVVLAAYAEKLRKLGVKDVTLTDAEDAVQASTNPSIVGKRLVPKGRGKAFVIKGVLGDPISGSQGTSTLTIPILVGDRRVGTLLVTRYLDPFSQLSHEAFVSRLIATLAVFAVGMLFSLPFLREVEGVVDHSFASCIRLELTVRLVVVRAVLPSQPGVSPRKIDFSNGVAPQHTGAGEGLGGRFVPP